jgi:hypothetical protein
MDNPLTEQDKRLRKSERERWIMALTEFVEAIKSHDWEWDAMEYTDIMGEIDKAFGELRGD